tara:strand:- start:595 stop:744 length:150 start_codon:yes stop_codon:yes gene_type:complete
MNEPNPSTKDLKGAISAVKNMPVAGDPPKISVNDAENKLAELQAAALAK